MIGREDGHGVDDVVYVCTRFLVLFFEFVSIALFLRAILSWFMQEGENVVMTFLALVTEPLILPIRRLCARFGWFQGGPLDMPFLLTAVLVGFVTVLLEGFL